MRLGKLSNDQLERLVLSKYKKTRPEVLSLPRVGDDCAIVDFKGDMAAISTDPITAAVDSIGLLSVHVNCNDAAAAGALPIGIMVTLLAPPSATEEQIEKITSDIAKTALEVGVDILGGHTEITDSVNRFVSSATVIARLPKKGILKGMSIGDDILLTKWAGLEGSSVIATDLPHRLQMLSEDQLLTLKNLKRFLSVVPEGLYGAKNGATAMHDVTEGGVYGALWEMSYMAGVGIRLNEEQIPVLDETVLLCNALSINPMRLLSSGCMLIACKDGRKMQKGLRDIGVASAVIGRAVKETGLMDNKNILIEPPQADELYKLF